MNKVSRYIVFLFGGVVVSYLIGLAGKNKGGVRINRTFELMGNTLMQIAGVSRDLSNIDHVRVVEEVAKKLETKNGFSKEQVKKIVEELKVSLQKAYRKIDTNDESKTE